MSLHQYILEQSRPARNPYFSLPDPDLLLSLREEQAKATRPKLPSPRVHKINKTSLTDVFGESARMTEEESTQFLLLLLKHSGIQPDLSPEGGVAQAMAAEVGANHKYMQRRYKAIVEKAGFTLEDGKKVTGGTPLITSAGDTTKNRSSTKPPTKRRKATEPECSTKRCKSNEGTVSKKKPKKRPIKVAAENTAEQTNEGEQGSNA